MAINSQKEIIKILKDQLNIANINAVPKATKVVVNVGIGQSKTNPKFTQVAIETLQTITGQKPVIKKAKKAISGFKIRQGDPVALMVTLRSQKKEDFLIKLANIVLPRMRDFRGLKMSGFDKNGNYSLGITEHINFSEISHDKAETIHGLSINIITNTKNNLFSKALLEAWGFPFEKN